MEFSPFLRQVFVAVGPQLGAMSLGGSMGFSCVLLQQLRSNDSNIRPDLDTITWITSMHGMAGVGAILMPTFMQLKGRKLAFFSSCLLLIIGWCFHITAKNVYMVFIAEVFLGLGSNCIAVVNLITVSEMLAPKYRTVSMMLLGINQSIGMVVTMSVGAFVHWQRVALMMCSPLLIALLMISLWPESPAWLFYKGQYEKFEKAFTWLRGTDDDAKEEMQALIIAQRSNKTKITNKSSWQTIREEMKNRDFYLPSLFMFLVILNFYISGGLCVYIYSKNILEIVTGDEKAALFGYLMIGGTFLFGGIFSLYANKYLNNKTILHIGGICNIFLLVAAIVTKLQSIGVISKNPVIFISIFLVIMVFYHSGFNTVTFTVAIELIPVKHRGFGGVLYNIITCVLFSCTVKSLPYMIMYFNIWGTFIFCSVSGIICQLLIWRYVPETKGKTLQEIEDYYNYGYFVTRKDKDAIIEVTNTMIESKM